MKKKEPKRHPVLLFSILRREEHSLDPGAEGTNELLLDASDGSNAATEGNFTLTWLLNIRMGLALQERLTVIAMVGGTALPENREISAMVCAMPAEGPSCGVLEIVFCPKRETLPWGWLLRGNGRECCGSS